MGALRERLSMPLQRLHRAPSRSRRACTPSPASRRLAPCARTRTATENASRGLPTLGLRSACGNSLLSSRDLESLLPHKESTHSRRPTHRRNSARDIEARCSRGEYPRPSPGGTITNPIELVLRAARAESQSPFRITRGVRHRALDVWCMESLRAFHKCASGEGHVTPCRLTTPRHAAVTLTKKRF